RGGAGGEFQRRLLEAADGGAPQAVALEAAHPLLGEARRLAGEQVPALRLGLVVERLEAAAEGEPRLAHLQLVIRGGGIPVVEVLVVDLEATLDPGLEV